MLPAALAYEALLAELGQDVEAVAKDLELYATEEPPSGYSLEIEGVGILREADARGWERFHLVGYSGGGAAAVAFAGSHADRLSSLALLEPAWAGNWSQSPAELAFWEELRSLEALPADRFLGAFVRLELAPGVESPPPPAEAPPFLANRPSGIRHLTRAFRSCDLERDALERFAKPVYFALGARSNPSHYEQIATRLAGVFSDFQLEVFEERHHFDPLHRVEPARLASSLRALWARSGA